MRAARPEVSGSFYRYPPPKLLFYLYGKQFTGVLAVCHQVTERFLYLREGVPVHATVSDEVPSIRTLCQQYALSDENEALKLQLLEKIALLFKLADADFAIYRTDHEYAPTPEQARRLRVHPRRAIHHGIRGGYDRDRVRAEIGTVIADQRLRIPVGAAESLSRYGFDDTEWQLVRQLASEPTSMVDLVACGIGDETACWRLAYSLLATQALEVHVPTIEGRKVATPVPVTRCTARPGTYRMGGRTLIPGQKVEGLSMLGADDPGELERNVQALSASFQNLDSFELLGVKRDADSEQIERAWTAQRERFDPDRLARVGLGHLREAALVIQGEIDAAHAALSDEKRRRAYLALLVGEARGNPNRARAVLHASRLVVEGNAAIERQQFAEALEPLKQAVELHPEDGEALALYAWACWKKGVKNPIEEERIQKQLLRAVQLAQGDPRPFRFLGEMYLAKEQWDRAVTCFRKALARADDDVDAQRGLRLATMRKDKSTGRRGSFFGRARGR